MYSEFEGQQEGEKILYVVQPHPLAKRVAIVKILLLAIFFFLITSLISPVIGAFGLVASIILTGIGIWWNSIVYSKSKTYLTDRRLLRLEVTSPFFQTKRGLFWTEALKAKGYAPNLFWRLFNIGIVEVQPQMDQHEGVRITDAYMFEDLANYIDKILYVVKNTPAELAHLRPFVPKQKGQRAP